MSEEEKIKISVNEEDMQNLINCYKKDIEYIIQLEKENKKYQEVIEKAIEYLEQPYRDNFDYSKSQLLEILKGVE